MSTQFLLLLFIGIAQTALSQTDSFLFAAGLEGKTPRDAGEPIYNGREHVIYHPNIEGIPYYSSRDWQSGTVAHQGVLYKDVFLKYDLVADEVIIRHINGFTPVILFTKRVQSFTLGGRLFVNLSSNDSAAFKPGVYEELNRGKLSLYAKRSKFLEETIQTNSLLRKFIDRHSFYVLKNGQYHLIKKEKHILELLGEKKEEVKAWLKASRIKYKSEPELALTQIVAHYNQVSR
jgi:hypothetical protein